VAIALPLAPIRQTVRRLWIIETVVGVGVLILLAGAAWLVLTWGMRPLEQITATATAIAAGDLTRRVPVAAPRERFARTEVGRLSLAVNGMLTNIESALAARSRSEGRLRRFVADASHELRTPLTSIRGYVQLLRQGILTVEDRPDVLRRVDDEAARMSTIVGDLLYLARLDLEPALRSEPVDLVDVVRDSIADALAVEPGRPVALELPHRCIVVGDDGALRQVVANLLSNVRIHTPPRTPVSVRVWPDGGSACLQVHDRGPGMPAAVAGRAFDRFARGTTDTGGSGLGLAIVAEIVSAHGGEVSLQSDPSAGTAVSVRLPAAGL
jgi:two-component system OmpR family sensor kinase